MRVTVGMGAGWRGCGWGWCASEGGYCMWWLGMGSSLESLLGGVTGDRLLAERTRCG